MASKTRESSITASTTDIDTKSAAAEHNIKMANSNASRKTCHKQLMTSKKVPVSISPLYAPEFSDNMCVTLNGYTIYVPCDGQTYMVAEPFAEIIFERISRVDEKSRAQDNMANIQKNCESYAGANAFITKA